MLNADTQWRETLLQQTTEKTYRDAYRPWQLAESNLGGDFPGGCRAHHKLIIAVTDKGTSPRRETLITIGPPEHGTRIEQSLQAFSL